MVLRLDPLPQYHLIARINVSVSLFFDQHSEQCLVCIGKYTTDPDHPLV